MADNRCAYAFKSFHSFQLDWLRLAWASTYTKSGGPECQFGEFVL